MARGAAPSTMLTAERREWNATGVSSLQTWQGSASTGRENSCTLRTFRDDGQRTSATPPRRARRRPLPKANEKFGARPPPPSSPPSWRGVVTGLGSDSGASNNTPTRTCNRRGALRRDSSRPPATRLGGGRCLGADGARAATLAARGRSASADSQARSKRPPGRTTASSLSRASTGARPRRPRGGLVSLLGPRRAATVVAGRRSVRDGRGTLTRRVCRRVKISPAARRVQSEKGPTGEGEEEWARRKPDMTAKKMSRRRWLRLLDSRKKRDGSAGRRPRIQPETGEAG